MRSTRTDTTVALALAIGLHALLLLGIFFTPSLRTPPAQGAPVVADLMDARALSPALLRALEPLPTPVLNPVEPVIPPPPEIEPPPRDLPELASVRDLAPEREAERLRQELAQAQAEAERLRQEQLAEAERQRQAELERQRRAEAERRRRETEAQLERIRNERARAEREERQAEERLREIERRRTERAEPAPSPPTASPPPGVSDGDTSLRAQWISAMVAKIEREWIRPDSIHPGSVCPIRIRMLAGGEVVSTDIQPACLYDEAAKRSVQAAVLKASPLPWAGYEAVAVRDFVVRFQPSSR